MGTLYYIYNRMAILHVLGCLAVLAVVEQTGYKVFGTANKLVWPWLHIKLAVR